MATNNRIQPEMAAYISIADGLASVQIGDNEQNRTSTTNKEDNASTTNKQDETKVISEHSIDFLKQYYDSGEAGGKFPDTLEVRRDPVKGEGLFARRDISVMEPVCSLPYPLFMALETEKLRTTCYSCLAVTDSHIPYLKGSAQDGLTLKACSGCQQVRFCGKPCQTKAWQDFHRAECKIFKKYSHDFPPMIIRIVLRIVVLHDKGLLSQDYWNVLMNGLVSHEEVWTVQPEQEIITAVADIKHATKTPMSVETITQLFWAMRTNLMQLPTSVHGAIGVIVDPLFSKINHNCVANVGLYRPWHTIQSGWNLESNLKVTPAQRNTFAMIIPLRDIKEGEELSIFYSDPTMSVVERNAKHLRSYYFECACSLCFADAKAAAEIEFLQPALSAQYAQWSEVIQKQAEALRFGETGVLGLDSVYQAFDQGIVKYLDHPRLYAASHFDIISLDMGMSGLKLGAFDKTLISFLRPYFLVYPTRISGRLNYFHVHISFITLAVFNVLLGIHSTDLPKVEDVTKAANVKQSVRVLSARGLDKQILAYWRERIAAYLRKCLESSVARDLLPMMAEMQVLTQLQGAITCGNEKLANEASISPKEENIKAISEAGMRRALRLSEVRWKVALEETGC